MTLQEGNGGSRYKVRKLDLPVELERRLEALGLIEGTTVTVRLPDRRSGVTLVRDMPFHYAGGFNPTLVELADALPYQAFTKNYIE